MGSGYSVGEIMVRDVITVSGDESLLSCAQLMRDKRVGCLIVCDADNVIQGIITEQDLARKVLAEGLDASEGRVADVMSSNVESIDPSKDLQDAVMLMGNNEIKHLPVVHEGKLAGLITAKDVVFIEPTLIEKLNFNAASRTEN